MLPEASPVTQALLGTVMTWGLTAAGAAAALLVKGNQVKSTCCMWVVTFLLLYITEKKIHEGQGVFTCDPRKGRKLLYAVTRFPELGCRFILIAPIL